MIDGRRCLLDRRTMIVATAYAFVISPAMADEILPPGATGKPQIAFDSTWYGTTPGIRYADVNVTLAPYGNLYETGVRMRFSAYWVGYNYLFSQAPFTLAWGDLLAGAFQVGYGMNTRYVNAIALVGPAINESQNAGVRATRTGTQGTLSISAVPTDELLVYVSAKYTTINYGYEAQGKVGWRVLEAPYVGVEGKLSGLLVQSAALVSQRSIGAHMTNIPIGKAFFGLSGGYVSDNQIGGGGYINASVYVAF